MSIDDNINTALQSLPEYPSDEMPRKDKKAYSEKMSALLAETIATELRERGMTDVRPAPPGLLDTSGAERRIAGGIGAKKVDITWATEESGLLLGISVKTINFRDRRSKNYQKNLTNRRGDMLMEAITLHKRFPYAVLIGMLIFPEAAKNDDTKRRSSTFTNAHTSFAMMTNRPEPRGADEKYEKFFITLHEANPFRSSMDWYEVGRENQKLTAKSCLDSICELVASRNSDFYSYRNGKITRS